MTDFQPVPNPPPQPVPDPGPPAEESAATRVGTWSLASALALLGLWIILQILFVSVTIAGYSIATGQGFDPRQWSMPLTIQAVSMVGQSLAVWMILFAVAVRVVGRPNSHNPVGAKFVLRALGFGAIPSIRALIQFAILGSLIFGAAYLIQQLIPGEEVASGLEALAKSRAGLGALVLAAVVIAPLAEEAFFRGFLLLPMVARFGVIRGATLNAVLFGLVHWATYGFQLGFIVPIAFMGSTMVVLRLRTGSLWPSVIAHAAFNSTSLILFLAGVVEM